MGAKIEYSYGEILNTKTRTKFLEEIPVEKGQLRKARCKCGYCSDENFITAIKYAKKGGLCPLCKSERISSNQLIKYKYGQILNEKTGSIYLEEAGFNSAHQRMGKIKCGYCGKEYEAVIANVKNGSLCPFCRNERSGEKISNSSKKYNIGDIIENPYGVKFILLEETYEKNKRECFFAPLDENNAPIKDKTFKSCVHSVLYGLTSGEKRISSLELAIFNYLDNHKIHYTFQKTFDDLLAESGYNMYYDFAIALRDSQTLLIEADGQQHFTPVAIFGGEKTFKEQQVRDRLKTEYVEKHSNLFLERIPYYEFKNINNILDDIVQYYNIMEEKEV